MELLLQQHLRNASSHRKRRKQSEVAAAKARRAKRRRRESGSDSEELERQRQLFHERASEDPGPTLQEASSNRMPHRHHRHVRRSGRRRRQQRATNRDYDFGSADEDSQDDDEEEAEEDLEAREQEEARMADMVEVVTGLLENYLPQRAADRDTVVGVITGALMNPQDLQANQQRNVVVADTLQGMNERLRNTAPVTLSNLWHPCVDPEMSQVYDTLGDPHDRSQCWGCQKSGPHSAATSVRAWENLTMLYYNNISTCKLVTLAQQLHKYFEEHIRAPANANLLPGQEPVPEWRAVDILMHMTRHTNEPVARINHLISVVNQMIDNLHDYGTYSRNGTYKWMTRPNSNAIRDVDRLVSMLLKLYRCNPERMFGSNQNSSLASNAAHHCWINPAKPSYGSRRSHPFRLTETSA